MRAEIKTFTDDKDLKYAACHRHPFGGNYWKMCSMKTMGERNRDIQKKKCRHSILYDSAVRYTYLYKITLNSV